MKGLQRNCDSASRLKAEQSTNVNNKLNRLSRTLRQTQQPSPAVDVNSPNSFHIVDSRTSTSVSFLPEFKTPTRLHTSRRYISFAGESPHSDSDFQQDIIWDPTSPPFRTGKSTRNRSSNAGVVDISDIVSRIAPKHGRPRVAEPTLQQWIGDSAAIPCTPDVQHPKFKRKSPRLNAVDDLLKLAKQFDLNMFQQDKDDPQRSLELLSEDNLDFGNSQEDVLQPMHPETSLITRDTSTGRESLDQPLDKHMENDLDFLFDGPTQQISRPLSQTSFCHPLEEKPSTVIPKEASGNVHCTSQCSSTVIMTHNKGASTVVDFEDDWENDDLLNDPVMFEMTQTPPAFSLPKHSSTQRGSCVAPQDPFWRDGPSNVPANGDVTHRTEKENSQSSVSKAQKEIGKDGLTFQLEATSDYQVKKILANTTNLTAKSEKYAVRSIKQSIMSSSKFLSIKTSSPHNRQRQHSNKVTSKSKDSVYTQRAATPNTSTKHSTFTSENNSKTQAQVTSVQKPVWQKDHPVDPFLGKDDLLDDDLDSLFSSDWDDQLDDNLLCEMCDNLESQTESTVGQSVVKQTLSVSQTFNQRLALAPSKSVWDINNQQTQVKQFKHVSSNSQSSPENATKGSSILPCKSAAVNSSSTNTVSLCVSSGIESYRQDLTSHLTSNTMVKWSTVVDKNRFTFKKPSNPVYTVASTKNCSAAEIERKKQQAMERRRQRMQATQNLRTAS